MAAPCAHVCVRGPVRNGARDRPLNKIVKHHVTDPRSVSRGAAVALLALLPAYCSIDGLVTGETLVIEKRTHSYVGTAAVVTAIAYGLFAMALIVAASTYFTANSNRRRTLVKCAWNVTGVATVLYFAGRIMWFVQ